MVPRRAIKIYNSLMLKVYMAGRTGLEPATSCVTGRRSNQLNYRPKAVYCEVLMVGGTGIEPVTSAL